MTADRPTQAEVDECMRMAREEEFGADDPTVYMRVLAAEVRALRRDVDLFRAASKAAELRIVQLREENAELQGDKARLEQQTVKMAVYANQLEARIASAEALLRSLQRPAAPEAGPFEGP